MMRLTYPTLHVSEVATEMNMSTEILTSASFELIEAIIFRSSTDLLRE